jgi:hypothetical protein
MTLDEAKKIATIIVTADNGCQYCVDDLVKHLNSDFPEFKWEQFSPYTAEHRVAVEPREGHR